MTSPNEEQSFGIGPLSLRADNAQERPYSDAESGQVLGKIVAYSGSRSVFLAPDGAPRRIMEKKDPQEASSLVSDEELALSGVYEIARTGRIKEMQPLKRIKGS